MSPKSILKPILTPTKLNKLGDFLPVFNFLNKSKTLRNIEQLYTERASEHVSTYIPVGSFNERYTEKQRENFKSSLFKLDFLKKADELITKRKFKKAIALFGQNIKQEEVFVFKNVIHELLYIPKKQSNEKIAKSYLTFFSNLHEIDVVLVNTKTSGNPYESLVYKFKTQITSEICQSICSFYEKFTKLKNLSNDLWYEIKTLKDNKPHKATTEEVSQYEKRLNQLMRKVGSDPYHVRNIMINKHHISWNKFTHSQRGKIIEGFITDIQQNIFSKWVGEVKRANKRSSKKKAMTKFRATGKPSYKTRVHDYYKSNPLSTIKDCALALGLDPGTVSKHKKTFISIP